MCDWEKPEIEKPPAETAVSCLADKGILNHVVKRKLDKALNSIDVILSELETKEEKRFVWNSLLKAEKMLPIRIRW